MVVERVVHVSGQVLYITMEGVAWLTRNSALLQELGAVRKAAHLYWTALALERRGKPAEAFPLARDAFAKLKEADRRETFSQMGVMVVTLLNRLAKEVGTPGGARVELIEALEVFRALRAEPGRASPTLDRVVNWLEHEVRSEPPEAQR